MEEMDSPCVFAARDQNSRPGIRLAKAAFHSDATRKGEINGSNTDSREGRFGGIRSTKARRRIESISTGTRDQIAKVFLLLQPLKDPCASQAVKTTLSRKKDLADSVNSGLFVTFSLHYQWMLPQIRSATLATFRAVSRDIFPGGGKELIRSILVCAL